MYFILLVFAFLLLLTVFRLFRKDCVEPAVIFCAYFAAALMAALAQYEYWHLYEYSIKAGCILILGTLSFVAGCSIAHLFIAPSRREREHSYRIVDVEARIRLDKSVLLLCMFQVMVTLVLFLLFFRRSANGVSLGALITNYKEGKGDGEIKLPLYLNFMIKVNEYLSYSALLVFLFNRITGKLKCSDFLLMVIPAAYASICLLMANRGNVLQLIMGSFCGWYILFSHIKGKPRFGAVMKKAVIIVIPTACLFWMFILFRMNASFTTDGFMSYIAGYASGGFSALDLYLLQDNSAAPAWFGEETFVALNNNLHSLFGLDIASLRFLEFRSGYGRSVVNIYTGFRRYYHDFRMAGVVILPFLHGFISTKVYQLIRWKTWYGVPFFLLLYCSFIYTVPYLLIDELFFSSVVSISGMGRIAIIYLIYRFFFMNSRLTYTVSLNCHQCSILSNGVGDVY